MQNAGVRVRLKRMPLTVEDVREMIEIGKRNIKLLGNAITQYKACIDVLHPKKDQDSIASYTRRITRLLEKQSIEEQWIEFYQLALPKNK